MTIIPWLGQVKFATGALNRSYDVMLGKMYQAKAESGADLRVPYLKSASVQWREVVADSDIAMWASPTDRLQLGVRRGDLLVCEGGDVGRCAIYDGPPGFVFEKSINRIRSASRSDVRYLKYVLEALHGSGWLEVICNRATISHLTREKLGALEIPLPDAETQRDIADFLDFETSRIDSTVKSRRAARILLLERRAGNIFRAVVQGDRKGRAPSGLAWVDSIPDDWKSVKLSYVARLGSGHTPSRNRPEWWVDCTIPWVTTGEVSQMRSDRLEYLEDTREKISHIGIENSSAELHPAGTVVLCRTAASAGYSAIIASNMATSQDIAAWTCSRDLKPAYLLWCLRAMRADLLGRLAIGSTHKTIYMPDLQALRIPLPSIAEQERIVRHIRCDNEAVDAAIDAVDQQLELLAERRKALITAVVTGQCDVSTASGVAT